VGAIVNLRIEVSLAIDQYGGRMSGMCRDRCLPLELPRKIWYADFAIVVPKLVAERNEIEIERSIGTGKMTASEAARLFASQRATSQFWRVVKKGFTRLHDEALLEILRLGHF
jgi:hypothetical protein